MKFYESSVLIHATQREVWNILTDASRYKKWDSGIERIEGVIAPGQSIKVISQIAPGQAFPVKVTEFTFANKMVWTGGMPFGLFKGVRTFTLSEQNGDTKFHMREEFSGPLLPLIWKSMPDLAPAFEQFARGLKACAESRTVASERR